MSVPVLSIRHLVKAYKPGQPVLKGISLDIEGHGLTAIIGPSGTGKSTLIRTINRLVEPTEGSIVFRGQDLSHISGRPLREARRRIGMIFQEYNLVERLSVMENLLTGRLGYVGAVNAWLWFLDGVCLDWVHEGDLDRDAVRGLLLGTLLGALTAAGLDPAALGEIAG